MWGGNEDSSRDVLHTPNADMPHSKRRYPSTHTYILSPHASAGLHSLKEALPLLPYPSTESPRVAGV